MVLGETLNVVLSSMLRKSHKDGVGRNSQCGALICVEKKAQDCVGRNSQCGVKDFGNC